MKKEILFFIIIYLSSIFQLYAQEYDGVKLIVSKISNLWGGTMSINENTITGVIQQNQAVVGIGSTKLISIDDNYDYMTVIQYNNQNYLILSNNLNPICEEKLPQNWITNYSSDNKIWVISYYLDILKSQDRESCFKYEKPYIDLYTKYSRSNDYRENADWWESTTLLRSDESLVINPATIIMGGFASSSFLIVDIDSLKNGYRITMKGDRWFAKYNQTDYEIRLPFPKYAEREVFDLIFIPDGDFMDVYLDTENNHFASFAKVDASILEKLNYLIKTNTCDLSNVKWPHRADGSMDYSPPLSVSSISTTLTTLDNLRLRDSANTNSKIVTTLLKGTGVQLLETGPAATIDGITAQWVKVLSSNGYTGWCFSGYLEPAAAK